MSSMSCMPPASPTQPKGSPAKVVDWTSTTGFIPCQGKPGPLHESWLAGRSHKKTSNTTK